MIIAADNHKVIVSAAVVFFTVGAITAAYTFVDLLFLSTYPAAWLPYLFLAKTVTLIVFTFLVGHLISRGSRWVNGAMLGAAAFSILAARWMLEFSFTGFPFVLALWLDAVGALAGVIAFNAVTDTFDLRRMKAIGRRIQIAAGVGGLLIGLSVPWIIDTLGSNQLLIVIAVGLLVAAIGTMSLQPLPVSFREARQSVQPMEYPLFVKTALACVLLLLIDTFADFALKREVALVYDREGIGAFMGTFYGLTNGLTVALQMSAVGLVARSMGIRGLLCAVPVFGIVISVGLFLFPGLWMAAAFRMGEIVLRRSFDDFGRALAANPLPGQVRRMARLLWNGVSAPIGTGLAALLLFALPDDAGMQGVAVITLMVSVVWLVLVHFTMNAYRETLEDAVRVHRIGSGDEAIQDDPQLLAELVQRSLASREADEIQFGFELLAGNRNPLPAEISDHLHAADPGVREGVIRLIALRGEVDWSRALLARLEIEEVPEIRWLVLETLAAIDASAAGTTAERLLDSALPEDRAGSVLVLLQCGDAVQLEHANEALAGMVTAPESSFRLGAARALGRFETGTACEALRTLLADPDPFVRVAALHAVSMRQEVGLIADVVALLGRGRASSAAGRTLTGFGEAAIPLLKGAAISSDYRVATAAMRSLAHIDSPKTAPTLMELNEAADVSLRSIIARESAKFAVRSVPGAAFVHFARDNVLQAADEIRALSAAAHNERTEAMRAEIEARLSLAKHRLVAWFATATEPARVLNVSPLVLPAGHASVPLSDRAKALELMETLTRDLALKGALAVIESPSLPASNEPVELDDEWLNWLAPHKINHIRGENVDLPQRVMLLRKCPLFNGLQGEALLAIAEVSELHEMTHGESIFDIGDTPDGLYVVASGFVNVMRGEEMMVVLRQADVIGELEMLDESPRLATAVAATDGLLLYINKQTFESITEDIPEVLRGLAHRVVGYLRTSLAEQSNELEREKTQFMSVQDRELVEQARHNIKQSAAPANTINDTVVNESGPSGPPGRFRKIKRGETVTLSGQNEEQIEIWLNRHLFKLRISEPPFIVDPQGGEFRLSGGGNMVGRDERCDVVVDSTFRDLSRQHIVIDYAGNGDIKLTNLSHGGTTVLSENVR